MKLTIRALAISSLAAVTLATGGVSSASAAVPNPTAAIPASQGNTISGTTPSDGTYYTSTILRHVSTANDTISFTPAQLPNGGLTMELVSSKNGAVFAGPVTFTQLNVPKTIATGVLNGTKFYARTK